MKFFLAVVTTGLGFGISASANAAYVVAPWINIQSGTIVSHETYGGQSGVPSTSFDAWGLTMDRNVSDCYDDNRMLPPHITPADGGPYASVFSLSTPSGSLDPYVTYICGWAWAYHCNNSSIWLHPIGTGVDGWGPAAYDVYSVYE
jgi:hypothetical protein